MEFMERLLELDSIDIRSILELTISCVEITRGCLFWNYTKSNFDGGD